MSAEAKNLKALQAAIVQHNGNCGSPILAILMNPFEVERLDWEDFQGIPNSRREPDWHSPDLVAVVKLQLGPLRPRPVG